MSPASEEVSLPWWVYKKKLAPLIPVPSEYGLDSSELGLGSSDISEWFFVREQLWAMQEALA